LLRISKNTHTVSLQNFDKQAAACLLAHAPNRNIEELIDILMPFFYDPSKSVRNNIMRILGILFESEVAKNLNIEPFIQMLDSPILTDRNKALCILVPLANQPQ